MASDPADPAQSAPQTAPNRPAPQGEAVFSAPPPRPADAAAAPPRPATPPQGKLTPADATTAAAVARAAAGAAAAAAAGGAPAAQLRWWIDDRPIGSGARAQWLPWPGRHVVQLRDAQGRVHDERRIQVRGAVAKTAPPRKPP